MSIDLKAKAIKMAMSMLPEDTFDNMPAQIEEFIGGMLSDVKVGENERAAVLIIEGITGYLVNIVKLDENSSITIVDQYTLEEFFNNIVNLIKNGKGNIS